DWLVPNFSCSAPPPDAFPFQLATSNVAPPAQVSPLLFAKLNRLASPARLIVPLPARMNRPSCSTALPICSVCDRLHVPGLLMRLGELESPITQSLTTLTLFAHSVRPRNWYPEYSFGPGSR